MAQTKKKTPSSRTSTSRGTSAKRGTSASRTKSKAAQEREYQQELRHRQIWAVILFVVGVLTAAMVFIRGTNIWYAMHRLLLGTFGIGVFAVPALMIYIAVRVSINPQVGRLRHKFWQSLVFMALFCALIQIIGKGSFAGNSFTQIVESLYQGGMALENGGVLSIVVGWPLVTAFGRTGAAIFIVLFMFAFVLVITGATLLDAFQAFRRPVQKIEDHYAQKREEREARFNIDVPLGPEEEDLPQHPVTAGTGKQEYLPPKKKRFMDILRQTGGTGDDSAEGAPEPPVPEPEPRSVSEDAADKPEGDAGENTAPLDDLVRKAIPDQPETAAETGQGSGVNPEPIPVSPPPAGEQQVIYRYPPVTLLKASVNKKSKDLSGELRANAELLVNTLKSFGVQTRVIDISRGPTVTRYELQPSAGVKISRITGLADDIALNLASAGVRIEAPIPNKAAVGIEVPNRKTDIVSIREIINSPAFKKSNSKLSVALGRDISGKEVVFDIAKMPHMLIAGATGSGKSVCINTLIMSLVYKSSPEDVRLLMIDPKVVELGIYNGIPHLLVPVVTDPRKAAGALGWAVTEMLNRYKMFADNQVRDLSGFNELAKKSDELEPMPQIVIIIDELADLMMAAPNEVEDSVCRLAQMARAAGMHLVIATQRPSVDVITGVIKANIPSRVAFAVSSQVDSRTILDSAGAEKLLGRGDMLFYPVGSPKPTRLQCCYVSDKEVESVVNFIKDDGAAEYDDNIIDEIEKQAVQEKSKGKSGNDGGGLDDEDELLPKAIECVIEAEQASTSYLQRRLKVGYARAARLMDDMETKGIIGPFEGSKPRQVLMKREQWLEMKMNQSGDGEES